MWWGILVVGYIIASIVIIIIQATKIEQQDKDVVETLKKHLIQYEKAKSLSEQNTILMNKVINLQNYKKYKRKTL